MTDTKKLSRNEQVRELTGHDEVTIRRRFGQDFDDLTGSIGLRALIFVTHRRSGIDEQAAYDTAMGLKLRDLDGYFGNDEDDPDLEADQVDDGLMTPDELSPAGNDGGVTD